MITARVNNVDRLGRNLYVEMIKYVSEKSVDFRPDMLRSLLAKLTRGAKAAEAPKVTARIRPEKRMIGCVGTTKWPRKQ